MSDLLPINPDLLDKTDTARNKRIMLQRGDSVEIIDFSKLADDLQLNANEFDFKTITLADPAPTRGGFYFPTQIGTYARFGNIEIVESDLNSAFTFIVFDGFSFSKSVKTLGIGEAFGVAPLDENKKIPNENINFGKVEEGDENVVSGGEVYENVVNNNTDSLLSFIDTPIYEERPILRYGEKDVNINSDYYLVPEFDRPDLSNENIFIDANNNIVSRDIISISKSESLNIELTDVYYNPPQQDAYSIGSSSTDWVDAGLYHELWEPFLNASSYVSVDDLGNSSQLQLPILKYEFKPKNPTRKIIIFGGNHGSEKIPVVTLYRFFNNFLYNYSYSAALQWARSNIHFIVVPLLSPDGYEKRSRRVMETNPIKSTWNKVGNIVTITFNEVDFNSANNNPRVSYNNYFSDSGIVNKTMVSLINSDNTTLLPNNGYLITANPANNTIQINVATSGDASGECDIYISTDPNRNYTITGNSWEDYTPSGTIATFNEPVAVRMDNKGTRPYSLQESFFAKNVIDSNNDATFLIDFHNGSGDYDTRWSTELFDRSGLDAINELHELYTSVFLDRVLDVNALGSYATIEHNMNGLTCEWGQHSPITIDVATDSQRWFQNLMIGGAFFYNYKIQ